MNWKVHKPRCMDYRASLLAVGPSVEKVTKALMAWGRRNSSLLQKAASSLLLPAVDYRAVEGHALDAEYLLVEVTESGESEFEITLAGSAPLGEYKEWYDGMKGPGAFERRIAEELMAVEESGGGRGFVGMMWICLVCKPDYCKPIFLGIPTIITEAMIEGNRQRPWNPLWLDDLKRDTGPGRGKLWMDEAGNIISRPRE